MDEGITNISIPEKCECCPHLFEYKCRAEKCPYDQTTDKGKNGGVIMENDKEFFKTEESFISWISAYYPAPMKTVSVEEYRKNVESWKRFIEDITKPNNRNIAN